MYRFNNTFVTALAFSILTSLAGCDEIEDPEGFDDDEEELELRSVLTPTANLPIHLAAEHGAPLSFSVPMYPVGKVKPKSGFGLPIPNNLAYIWTPDPAAPNTILVDANGASPYSGDLTLVQPDVCDEFLIDHPDSVPVTDSLESCQEAEQGCCDRICHLWQAVPYELYGENEVTAVTNDTFERVIDGEPIGQQMLDGSYVPSRLSWNMNAPNGGHSTRAKVCACHCELVVDINP